MTELGDQSANLVTSDHGSKMLTLLEVGTSYSGASCIIVRIL